MKKQQDEGTDKECWQLDDDEPYSFLRKRKIFEYESPYRQF
jgi:hypothetical protein